RQRLADRPTDATRPTGHECDLAVELSGHGRTVTSSVCREAVAPAVTTTHACGRGCMERHERRHAACERRAPAPGAAGGHLGQRAARLLHVRPAYERTGTRDHRARR